MTARILSGLGRSAVTAGFVVVLNFFLFRTLPGDPSRAAVRDPRLSEETQRALKERFGLDLPVCNGITTLRPFRPGSWSVPPADTQFGRYVAALVGGDLGVSFQSGEPVLDLLRQRAGATALLVLPAELLAIVLGTGLGFLAAWKAGRPVDGVSVSASLFFWSLPAFWLGLILLFWGSGLGFPVSGMATPGPPGTPVEQALDLLSHLFLPTLTQALLYLGQYVLLARGTVFDILSEDYILAARARGLSAARVLSRHAARNAALPLVTLVALNLGFTIAGAIEVEAVFSWPGLGLATFEAVLRRDYPVLQGAFLMLTLAVVLANLVADLLCLVLDPRLRESPRRA